MEGRRMILATRSRKARRHGRCPLCRGPVHIGQYIARIGLAWVHNTCAASRVRDHSRPAAVRRPAHCAEERPTGLPRTERSAGHPRPNRTDDSIPPRTKASQPADDRDAGTEIYRDVKT
jgi:hypothetical protein